MSADYANLLESTIQHLEQLKANGTRYLAVEPAVLAALRTPLTAPVRSKSPSLRPSELPSAIPTRAVDSPVSPRPESAPTAPVEMSKMEEVARFSIQRSANPVAESDVKSATSPQAKEQAMAELRTQALACVKCLNLAAARKNVVFGVGDIHAKLMFVGEAPGADEDAQGEPFVGPAGQLLTKIIQTMGLSRQSVYIANILKCRPDTPGRSAGNRKPAIEEMHTCLPYLQSQIDLIQPRVLVALGATAVEGLLGKTLGITKLRGNWREYREIPLMPTYHPAYLLRNQSNTEKRKVWEDMLQVMEKLGMEISEKQRAYFLG